ncbi:MAG TPA: SRPBCC family protein [Candidatus Limnocylindrales bacterium]|nr:SRPBCC family protein [Candidatus Limnocylindrales bacterium]
MATVELSVTIERPLVDVYRVLTTPELTPRWSSSAVEEHMTTAGPIRVGSRRRATVRRLGCGTTENEIEVTELEPERRIAVRSLTAPVPFRSEWTFAAVDAGTRVDWRWDFEMTGWLRPFDGLIGPVFGRTFRRDLDRLKSMMESGEL